MKLKALLILFLAVGLFYQPAFARSGFGWGGGFNEGDADISKNSVVLEEKDADPDSPSANKIKLYAKDDTGTTTLYTKDSSGTVTALGGGGLENVVEDTTPQLGGSLDVNGQKIVSVSNGNIDIEPNGTGNVLLGNLTFDADQTVGAGQDNYVLTYDNGTGLVALEAAGGGGLTVGTTAIASGTAGRVLFEGAGNVLQEDSTMTFDAATDVFGVTSITANNGTLTKDSIGTTATAALNLINNTAASSGNQQISPAAKYSGNGWKTDSTAASRSIDWFSYLLPVQGASKPTPLFLNTYSINGATAVRHSGLSLDDAGDIIHSYRVYSPTDSASYIAVGWNRNIGNAAIWSSGTTVSFDDDMQMRKPGDDSYKLYVGDQYMWYRTFGGGLLIGGSNGSDLNVGINNDGAGRANLNVEGKINIGSATPSLTSGQVNIDGYSDITQLLIQGHSTQTNEVILVEKSDGTDLFKVNNAGETFVADTNTGGNAGTDLCIDANNRICACGSCA